MRLPDWNEVRQQALVLGFEDLGVCSATPFGDAEGQPFVSARVQTNPADFLPEARSLVVLVRRYGRFVPWHKGAAQVAHYYANSNDGYAQAAALARWLGERGVRAAAHPNLPHKAAAVRAGLGCQGQNTQFIHHALGVLVCLQLLVTDLPPEGDDHPWVPCRGCGLCVAACPTNALEGGQFHWDRCLRVQMGSPDPVPRHLRRAMGMRLIGCTECQHACPHCYAEEEPVPETLAADCDLEGLLRGDAAQRERLAAVIGTNYARRGRLMAQAALCAGNSGDRRYVPLLTPLLGELALPVRVHAAWALGRLGGPGAAQALRAALATADDPVWREEIEAAIAALPGVRSC